MRIHITVTREPIESHAGLLNETPEGCGAMVEFRGMVRGEEHGRRISALVYEAYELMAERQIDRILKNLAVTLPCEEARVLHRIGTVPVGKAAIIVQVVAKHRAEAFAMVAGFMDRLKQDVPIWKTGGLS